MAAGMATLQQEWASIPAGGNGCPFLPAGTQECCHPLDRRQHHGLPGGAAGAMDGLESDFNFASG